ncbi:TetR/AcrR family transcriptional regulator [Nocardia arthritidis]|uniref:TetR family transcriptional regulator n=1 Tax=Nocardia arthritidis TaxID=228602 RepID=A0A6G9YFV4_9NOCA|nr:TetR/AcrR family transcriptional regulator [Nocardia arthritidis]QIS11926.1 TetR family transcriptional regulator [Nocardia arthritidis]
MASATASGVPPKRVTRRRAQTRDRLLAAAYEVFAAEGFGRSTVEKVCERAGFTRGAFYSNFGSLDELFLAMWEHRSAQLLADVRTTLDGIAADGVTELRVMIERLAGAVPVDEAWFRITAEFTAHALRDPELRRVVAAREAAILEALMPPVVATLAGRGRAVPDPVALGQALVAVHDGTAVQVLLEPRSRTVRERRIELFHHVVLAYSTAQEG